MKQVILYGTGPSVPVEPLLFLVFGKRPEACCRARNIGKVYAGYEEVSDALGARFLVKQINGSKGENIFMVNDMASFDEAAGMLRPDCIFQKFIEESSGRDIRVWVLGDECIGSVLRYSETSFLSNYSQGGSFKAVELDGKARELAVKAVQTVGLRFAGVDLLFSGNSYSVCEVNGNAGFRTISKASDVSIPHALFVYISDVLNSREFNT